MVETLTTVWWLHARVGSGSLNSGLVKQGERKHIHLQQKGTICLDLLNNLHLHGKSTYLKGLEEFRPTNGRELVLCGSHRGLRVSSRNDSRTVESAFGFFEQISSSHRHL